MPELPEVETVRRGIAPWLENAVLKDVVIRNGSLRWPVPTNEVMALRGQPVIKLERRAKYLLITFPSAILLLHLGMSGSIRVLGVDAAPTKHDHIDLVIKTQAGEKRVVRFNDPRRFGCCLVLQPPAEKHPLLVRLGPEPLSGLFDGDLLFTQSRGRRIAVKSFIMDGKVVVGVGNIYASESLHLAGIRPGIAAGRVTRARYAELAEAIKEVLGNAIIAGGTTLSDFTQSDGNPGYFSQELQVYGRAGEQCFRCNGLVRSKVMGQRNTFYCSGCQS